MLGWKPTTHLHLVPSLRMCGAVPPLLLYDTLCTRETFSAVFTVESACSSLEWEENYENVVLLGK